MLGYQRVTVRNGGRFLALTVLLTGLATTTVASSADPVADPGRYALLVGCTEYPRNKHIRPLTGPANDVRLFGELLKSRFGFTDENITTLVGWPEDETARPTRANITVAFERLIDQAVPGDQVVILLSGHGAQSPIPAEQEDPFDPENFEPDGMDEYFLPADVGTVSQGLRDNTIGDWLDSLRAAGASVWIIFDCCHAGTMTRDAGDAERPRAVPPQVLGVSPESLAEARQKVRKGRERLQREGASALGIDTPLALPVVEGAMGGLTAYYAAQSFETAPELPRPADAPRAPEHYHGLLTWTICQVLHESEGSQTHRDLSRRIVSRYRGERGSRGPTPLFEGDLDRDVLGTNLGPRLPIFLERRPEGTYLSTGALAGLTPGSILSVHPKGGIDPEGKNVLGHVRITAVSAARAEVEAVEFGGMRVVPLEGLPDAARCRIVERDVGDMRVKVAIRPAGENTPPMLQANLQAALEALSEEKAALIQIVEEDEAEWLLRLVRPGAADDDFDKELEARLNGGVPEVFLLAGAGQQEKNFLNGDSIRPRVYSRYPAEPVGNLAAALSRDLHKIFTWQNVWRVAIEVEAIQNTSASDIDFEVLAPDNQLAVEGEIPRSAGHLLAPGQRIELRMSNTSFYDQWVTLLYLNANYEIRVLWSGTMFANQEFPPWRRTISDSSFGGHGFVVMSVRTREVKDQPVYDFLEQPRLGIGARSVPRGQPQNPFARLMHSAASGDGVRTRSARMVDPATPQVRSWTWETVPAR